MTTYEEKPRFAKIKQIYKDAGLALDELLALEDFGFNLDELFDLEHDTNNPSDLDSALLDTSADEPVKITEDQYGVLRAYFSENPYPSAAEVNQLAENLEVSALKIKAYFGGRRGTLRRKMKRQGIQITSKQQMCLYVLESRSPACGEFLFKPDEAEDEDDHIGHEASGGKYLDILCGIGMDFVKSY